MDLGIVCWQLLTSQEERALDFMCFLLKELNTTHGITKEVEPESDPASRSSCQFCKKYRGTC